MSAPQPQLCTPQRNFPLIVRRSEFSSSTCVPCLGPTKLSDYWQYCSLNYPPITTIIFAVFSAPAPISASVFLLFVSHLLPSKHKIDILTSTVMTFIIYYDVPFKTSVNRRMVISVTISVTVGVSLSCMKKQRIWKNFQHNSYLSITLGLCLVFSSWKVFSSVSSFSM